MVVARDGDQCWICGEKVTRLTGRTPPSASIDHVIPLEAGGTDTPANLRLAHYGCNSSRRGIAP